MPTFELFDMADEYLRIQILQEGPEDFELRLTVFSGFTFCVFPRRGPDQYRLRMNQSDLVRFLECLDEGSPSRHGRGNGWHRTSLSIRSAPARPRVRDIVLHSRLFVLWLPPVMTTLSPEIVSGLLQFGRFTDQQVSG